MEKHKLKILRVERTKSLLSETFPGLFTHPIPLKIGIRQDLYNHFKNPRIASNTKLTEFLHIWCNLPEYQKNLAASRFRYDLNGDETPNDHYTGGVV